MRVAVIGAAGHAGRRHCETFGAAGWNVAPIEKEPPGGWRKIGADVFSICTPDNLHAEMVLHALERGAHVICEKPLTHRMDELDAIEAAAHKADGQTFATNFPLRHVPNPAKNKLVSLYRIDAAYEYGRRSKYWNSWRAKMSGYSPMCGGGIHLVDLIIGTSCMEIAHARLETSGGYQSVMMYEAGRFTMDDRILVRVTADFSFNGPHRTWITGWTYDGPIRRLDLVEEPYDKTADIRAFIHAVENGLPGNGADAIRANRLCIQMSQT